MIYKKYFPSLSKKEVMERVNSFWDFSKGFPFPKTNLSCPVCGHDVLQVRNWGFAFKDSGGCKYRCNVSFKCTRCSFVWVHGVVIPKDVFDKFVPKGQYGKSYHWREVKEMIDECY